VKVCQNEITLSGINEAHPALVNGGASGGLLKREELFLAYSD